MLDSFCVLCLLRRIYAAMTATVQQQQRSQEIIGEIKHQVEWKIPSSTRKDYYAKQTRRVNALRRRLESRWLCCCTVRKIIGCGGEGLCVESRLGSEKPDANLRWTRKQAEKLFTHSSRRVSAKKRVFVRHKSLPYFQHGAVCSVGETGEKWKCKHTHTAASIFRDFTRHLLAVLVPKRVRSAHLNGQPVKFSGENVHFARAPKTGEKRDQNEKNASSLASTSQLPFAFDSSRFSFGVSRRSHFKLSRDNKQRRSEAVWK